MGSSLHVLNAEKPKGDAKMESFENPCSQPSFGLSNLDSEKSESTPGHTFRIEGLEPGSNPFALLS